MVRDAAAQPPSADLPFVTRTLGHLGWLGLASTVYLATAAISLGSGLVLRLAALSAMVSVAAHVATPLARRSLRVASIMVAGVTGTTAVMAAWLAPSLAPAAAFGGLAIVAFALALEYEDVRRAVQATGALTAVCGVLFAAYPQGSALSAWVWLPSTLATLAIALATTGNAQMLLQQRHDARLVAQAEVVAQRARAAAKEAALRERAELHAGLHHELRAPLQSILYAVHDLPSEQTRRLRSSTQHLSSLLDDLMDVARIDAGSWSMREHRFRPETAIRDAIDIVQGMAQAQDVAITVDLEDVAPAYLGDARRLRQVTINLVGNAVRHCPGGHVDVRVRGYARGLVLQVDDDGPGFEDDGLVAAFQQGARPGVGGLGLSVVQRITEAAGGEMRIARSPVGGARVEVRWPARPEQATPRPLADLEGLRVLVCDDDALLLGLTVEIVSQAGATCVTAGTLHDAATALAERPDVILMDLHLPDGDGLEIVAAATGIPVVFLTGAPSPETVAALHAGGAWGVVDKPCEPEGLLDVVAAAAQARTVALDG